MGMVVGHSQIRPRGMLATARNSDIPAALSESICAIYVVALTSVHYCTISCDGHSQPTTQHHSGASRISLAPCEHIARVRLHPTHIVGQVMRLNTPAILCIFTISSSLALGTRSFSIGDRVGPGLAIDAIARLRGGGTTLSRLLPILLARRRQHSRDQHHGRDEWVSGNTGKMVRSRLAAPAKGCAAMAAG